MRGLHTYIHFLLLGISSATFSQRIDQSALYRHIDHPTYLRIHYENDFFVMTDQYYTQGMQVEYVHPGLKKNPVSYLLLRLKHHRQYGLSVEHNAYTPTTILSDSILYRDRPYAAGLFLKSFSISTDTVRKLRISNGWTLGVIGPAAGAKEMQQGVHKLTGNYAPLGWQYQIRNDLALNYEVNMEKLVFAVRRSFTLHADLQLKTGTLNNKIQAGFTIMTGKIPSLFLLPQLPDNDFYLYLYVQPLVSLVGYDATLQGGVFNRSSPHILNASEISRLTLENHTGVVVRYRKAQAEAFVSLLTKEFNSGKPHRWGGLKLSLALD